MLHAFARNKSRAYTRYLGARDPSESRVCSEDEITSTIFGPLDFISPSDHWDLWKRVLQNHGSNDLTGPMPADFIGTFSPTASTLEFWPKKEKIEPDLVIRFSDNCGKTRSLLIELKWDAPTSGDDQLQKQWLYYHHREHDSSMHLFIAKRMGSLPADRRPWASITSDGSPISRLRAIRWQEFRDAIAKVGGMPTVSVPLRRWCVLTSGFLGQVGICRFVGFHEANRLAASIAHQEPGLGQFWSHFAKPLNI